MMPPERLTDMDPARIPPARLITPGVMAEKIGVPLHRVLHVLATRRHIAPRARAGTLRLYDTSAVEAVKKELDAIRTGTAVRHAR